MKIDKRVLPASEKKCAGQIQAEVQNQFQKNGAES